LAPSLSGPCCIPKGWGPHFMFSFSVKESTLRIGLLIITVCHDLAYREAEVIPVDALLFDLDGTLVDSRRDLALSVQFLQRHYGARRSSERDVAAFVGDGVVKLVQRALPALPHSKLDEALMTFKKYYRAHCLDHSKLYPGVRDVLRHFRRKKMAVVTNKPVRVSGH